MSQSCCFGLQQQNEEEVKEERGGEKDKRINSSTKRSGGQRHYSSSLRSPMRSIKTFPEEAFTCAEAYVRSNAHMKDKTRQALLAVLDSQQRMSSLSLTVSSSGSSNSSGSSSGIGENEAASASQTTPMIMLTSPSPFLSPSSSSAAAVITNSSSEGRGAVYEQHHHHAHTEPLLSSSTSSSWSIDNPPPKPKRPAPRLKDIAAAGKVSSVPKPEVPPPSCSPSLAQLKALSEEVLRNFIKKKSPGKHKPHVADGQEDDSTAFQQQGPNQRFTFSSSLPSPQEGEGQRGWEEEVREHRRGENAHHMEESNSPATKTGHLRGTLVRAGVNERSKSGCSNNLKAAAWGNEGTMIEGRGYEEHITVRMEAQRKHVDMIASPRRIRKKKLLFRPPEALLPRNPRHRLPTNSLGRQRPPPGQSGILFSSSSIAASASLLLATREEKDVEVEAGEEGKEEAFSSVLCGYRRRVRVRAAAAVSAAGAVDGGGPGGEVVVVPVRCRRHKGYSNNNNSSHDCPASACPPAAAGSSSYGTTQKERICGEEHLLEGREDDSSRRRRRDDEKWSIFLDKMDKYIEKKEAWREEQQAIQEEKIRQDARPVLCPKTLRMTEGTLFGKQRAEAGPVHERLYNLLMDSAAMQTQRRSQDNDSLMNTSSSSSSSSSSSAAASQQQQQGGEGEQRQSQPTFAFQPTICAKSNRILSHMQRRPFQNTFNYSPQKGALRSNETRTTACQAYPTHQHHRDINPPSLSKRRGFHTKRKVPLAPAAELESFCYLDEDGIYREKMTPSSSSSAASAAAAGMREVASTAHARLMDQQQRLATALQQVRDGRREGKEGGKGGSKSRKTAATGGKQEGSVSRREGKGRGSTINTTIGKKENAEDIKKKEESMQLMQEAFQLASFQDRLLTSVLKYCEQISHQKEADENEQQEQEQREEEICLNEKIPLSSRRKDKHACSHAYIPPPPPPPYPPPPNDGYVDIHPLSPTNQRPHEVRLSPVWSPPPSKSSSYHRPQHQQQAFPSSSASSSPHHTHYHYQQQQRAFSSPSTSSLASTIGRPPSSAFASSSLHPKYHDQPPPPPSSPPTRNPSSSSPNTILHLSTWLP